MFSIRHIQLVILLATTEHLLRYTVKGTQKETTCSTTTKGTSGSITCHFSANLNVTKQDFNLRSSRLDGTDTVWLVDCTWESYDRTKCFIGSSYTFNGKVSQEAVIHIPELMVRDEREKRYWCHVFPSEYSLTKPCSFKLPDLSAGSLRTTEIRQEIFIPNNDMSRVSPGAITSIVVGVLIMWLLLL